MPKVRSVSGSISVGRPASQSASSRPLQLMIEVFAGFFLAKDRKSEIGRGEGVPYPP